MESFDEFFLFITSALGFFFSFTYTLLGYREVVYGFLPLLIIGLVIPIYIGYVRGAILLDMLEERVRGWIYFLCGVFVYIASSILFIVDKLLMLSVGFETFSRFFIFGGSLLIGYFISSKRLHRWFCRNVFEAFNHKMTKLTDKIYTDTSSSALLIGLFLYISFILSLSETFDLWVLFMTAFFISSGMAFFVWSERDIRKWISLVRFSDFIEIESKKARSYISTRVGTISWLISLTSIAIVLFLLKWLPLLVQIGLLIIFLFGQILTHLSTEKKYTLVRKKDVPKDVEIELTKLLNRITEKQVEGQSEGKA